MARTIRIGTRGSALARWQADTVQRLLTDAYPEFAFEQVIISTTGDRETAPSLSSFGGVGVFAREIESALLDDRIDIAVHSLKDLPSRQPEGLAIGAVLEREDPRDAFCSQTISSFREIPKCGTVATSSVRRRAQILHLRPDLNIVSIRGNVPTRLQKLANEELDGVILATAGLVRLGLDDAITEVLEPEIMLPAPGQGAVAVELREADSDIGDMLRASVHHDETAHRVKAERAVMRTFGGGCHIPLGALATIEGESIRVDAMVAAPDGSKILRESAVGPVNQAEQLGVTLGEKLIEQGGRTLVGA